MLNIGGAGSVCVEGRNFTLRNLDVLYVGRGHANISFASQTPEQPAILYLLSYPAHRSYPVTLVTKEEAKPTPLGSQETCNQRIVNRYIHLEGARSCQLVMGVTHLQNGNAWNTMPPHTHMRRSEIYMYFNLADDARVFHRMGPPRETRHFVLANRDMSSRPAGPSMPAWAHALIVSAGAWAAKIRTMPTWTQHRSTLCSETSPVEKGISMQSKLVLAAALIRH